MTLPRRRMSYCLCLYLIKLRYSEDGHCHIIYLLFCSLRLRKKASPGTRCVYNSTRDFKMKDNTRNFRQKLISFRLSVCMNDMLVHSKIWSLAIIFATLFQTKFFLKYKSVSKIFLSDYYCLILRNTNKFRKN